MARGWSPSIGHAESDSESAENTTRRSQSNNHLATGCTLAQRSRRVFSANSAVSVARLFFERVQYAAKALRGFFPRTDQAQNQIPIGRKIIEMPGMHQHRMFPHQLDCQFFV